jgi:alpha-N-arabinofuranosidase
MKVEAVQALKKEPHYVDNFSSPTLDPRWNYLRNPIDGITTNEQGLILPCHENRIDDLGALSMLCCRQQGFEVEVKTTLSFAPQQVGEEAGLVVFYNNEHHYEIYKIKTENGDLLRVNRRIGDLSSIVHESPADDQTGQLAIKASRLEYTLGLYRDGEFVELAKGRSRYLSTEVTVCSFTGVYFGLYATSNGKPSEHKAVFKDFEMIEVS